MITSNPTLPSPAGNGINTSASQPLAKSVRSDPSVATLVDTDLPLGCMSDASTPAAVDRILSKGSPSSAQDNPALINDMRTLVRSHLLRSAAPAGPLPGADGVVTPNERHLAAFGQINGVEDASLAVTAKRSSPKAPWGYTCLLGQNKTILVSITQMPIEGSPGRFRTSFEVMTKGYPKLDRHVENLNNNRAMTNTGPLQVRKAADGGVAASIDGKLLAIPDPGDLLL
jgi:hypothetical protein